MWQLGYGIIIWIISIGSNTITWATLNTTGLNFTCSLPGSLTFILLGDWLWLASRPTTAFLAQTCRARLNPDTWAQSHHSGKEETRSEVGGRQRRVKRRRSRQAGGMEVGSSRGEAIWQKGWKELDKVVICWEDRGIISVVRSREEIRIVVHEEKAHVKREWGRSKRKPQTLLYRAAVRVADRVEERKALGRRAGRGELPSSRGEMEPNPTAVRTYYQKQNNCELGALLCLLSPEPMSHWAKGIIITSNTN